MDATQDSCKKDGAVAAGFSVDLVRVREELEQERKSHFQFRASMEATLKQRAERVKNLEAKIRGLEEKLSSVQFAAKAEKERLLNDLHLRFKEISLLIARLEEQEAARMQERSEADTAGRIRPHSKRDVWPMLAKLMGFSGSKAKRAPKSKDFRRRCAMVGGSNYFDRDWYLETYTDVARARMDPIKHYLMHGAMEGRNPGPFFDSAEYKRQHASVDWSVVTPLEHFLLSEKLSYSAEIGRKQD